MGKLIFAAVVLVVGLAFYYALKRQADLFRSGALALVPRVVLALAVGIPCVVFIFSIFRIIPAGQVGIKQQYLARWDGRLPQYMLGGNATPLIQLPGQTGESPRR